MVLYESTVDRVEIGERAFRQRFALAIHITLLRTPPVVIWNIHLMFSVFCYSPQSLKNMMWV